MIKKIVYGLIACSCLIGGFTHTGVVHAGTAVTKKRLPQPGDVLAVEVNIQGVTQIILVTVHDDGSMSFIYLNKEYPFPAADLNEYLWSYYIKK